MCLNHKDRCSLNADSKHWLINSSVLSGDHGAVICLQILGGKSAASSHTAGTKWAPRGNDTVLWNRQAGRLTISREEMGKTHLHARLGEIVYMLIWFNANTAKRLVGWEICSSLCILAGSCSTATGWQIKRRKELQGSCFLLLDSDLQQKY